MKTHQNVFGHITLEELKNTTITAYFGFVIDEFNLRLENYMRAPFPNGFLSTRKRSQRFQIPPVRRAFPKSSVFVTD